MWRSLAGTKYFLARGSFSESELSPDLLWLILKTIAGVSVACTKQLQGLSELVVEDFFSPAGVPAGETPLEMPAEVHFSTFIAAFTSVLKYDMGSAPKLCKRRIAYLRKALEVVLGSVQDYLQFHFMAVAPHKKQVRGELLRATNNGFDE